MKPPSNITRRPGETEQAFNDRLAAFIAGFWAAQGRTVNAAASRAMEDSTGNGWLPYRVRSDMKNGFPPKEQDSEPCPSSSSQTR
ncbi:hypothetical protein IWQ49_006397 [Labrenzia sp. EL_126]|nr:hypothetical protein [Labrenzia sp. EL_126]